MGDDLTPDDLMSKFDAIERMLTARRQVEHGPDEHDLDEHGLQEHGVQEHGLQEQRAGASVPPRRSRKPRPPRRQLVVASLIVLALAVGGTAVALTQSDSASGADPLPSSSPSSSATTFTPTQAELDAATWVSAAVGPTHEVACDADICALLRQDGVPATSVISSRVDISAVAGADVVITTAATRAALGTSLFAITSAQPLASFGSGDDRVDVTVVAPSGTADYAERLLLDRAARKRVGTALVHNRKITLSDPSLAAALTSGQVDSRLCSLLALLGGSHTITIASFTPAGPGAGPDIPDATMVVTLVDGRSATGNSPEARALLALLAAQQPPYRPAAAVAETTGLRIAFAQPEPLGLLSGAKP